MIIEQISKKVARLKFELSTAKIAIISDLHIDSVKCDQQLLLQHLNLAKRENASIILNGDIFDCMQSKKDFRGNREAIRPELKVDNYSDALVDYVYDFLEPFIHNIVLINEGNHETAFARHMETDLIGRLVHRMNHKRKLDHAIIRGHYAGWLMLSSTKGDNTSVNDTIRLFYHHGAGGGAPVTKGTIKSARFSAYMADANIVTFGHNHNAWYMPVQKLGLTSSGNERKWLQHYINTPSYKDTGQWATEKGFAPQPKGCVMLHVELARRKKATDYKITVLPNWK